MKHEISIFDRIENDSVADAVAAQIEDLIITGVLRSGQRLPSEREVAEQTGVSRPKVRDAIKLLENRGLLAVHHGEGTFVAPLTGTALAPPMIDLFTRHPAAFGSYLEFRREIESYAAFTAAQRATEDDRKIISMTLAQMTDARKVGERDRELSLDVQFHGAIVDAAHNLMLTHVMSSIYDLLAQGVFVGRELYRVGGATHEALLEQHHKIGKAVIDGDADRAAVAAEEHINFVEASYRESHGLELRSNTARKRRKMLVGNDMPNRRNRSAR